MRLAAVLLLVLVASACAGEGAVSPSELASAALSSEAATPSTTPSPSPSPTPSPSPATAAVHWEQITSVDAPDPFGDWRLLAGFDGGYVALQRSPPAAWFSPDGTTWTRTALKAPEGFAGSADAIASDGESILVGGDYIPCTRRQYSDDPFHECRPRPVTWISSDGLEWRTSGPWKGPTGEEGRSGSSFLTVWPVPTGGWDAGQMFNGSDESDDFPASGPALWHSSDGIDWTQLTDRPGEDIQCGTFGVTESFDAAADATGRRVAATGAYEECPYPVFTSSDGTTYEKVDTFPTEGQTYMTVVLPPAEGLPWRLFGGLEETGQAFAWSSADLRAWSTAPINGEGGAVVLAAAHEPGRDIAVGRNGRTGGTWISEDGETWRMAADATTKVETLAVGPAGTLGLVGTWSGDGSEVTGFEVWKLVDDR
jgi:hypothetical protein